MDVPDFHLNERGKVNLRYSSIANAVQAEKRNLKYVPPVPAEEVRRRAIETVERLNGDTTSEMVVLGAYQIVFGQFRGETFHWLLSNALGYAANLSVDKAPKLGNVQQTKNRDALVRYMAMFPQSKEAMSIKRTEKAPVISPSVKAARQMEMDDASLLATVQAMEAEMQGVASGSKSTVAPVEATPLFDRSSSTSVEDRRQEGVASCSNSTLAPVEPLGGSSSTTEDSRQKADASVAATDFIGLIDTTRSSSGSSSGPSETSLEKGASSATLLPVPHVDSASVVTLSKKWRDTIPAVDQEWICRTLFERKKGQFYFDWSAVKSQWVHPPRASITGIVRQEHHFAHSVFLWCPVKFWRYKLACPQEGCDGDMLFAQVHPRVRKVLDVDRYYLIITEYLMCDKCGRKQPAWSHDIIRQLDVPHQLQFPCLLTQQRAADLRVVRLMRSRSKGNSTAQLQRKLAENHGEEWMSQCVQYLSKVSSLQKAAQKKLISGTPTPDELPAMIPLPCNSWLLHVYALDVLKRSAEMKASITSIFGNVLKMDSTKKIVRKLSGFAKGSANWCTNVGNEMGQVLMSVLTVGEGRNLVRMCTDLVTRYRDAGESPPSVIYVDRDCCGGLNYFKTLWPETLLRLDIWHFMRRIARGCTSETHPLYARFMRQLSECIFEWDAGDVDKLVDAKRTELGGGLTRNQVMSSLRLDELAIYCRRRTRGVEATNQFIWDLLLAFKGDAGCDTLGVPLIDWPLMQTIWRQQSRHIRCIQDPTNVALYTRVATSSKGGMELTRYRCARGSTSLESFHLYQNAFIPGTSANAGHFQAMLLDGVCRWNADRETDAVKGPKQPTSYSGLLKHTLNELSVEVLGRQTLRFDPPRSYTGEMIGLEYLFHQTGQPYPEYSEMEDEVDPEDETLEEELIGTEVRPDPTLSHPTVDAQAVIVKPPVPEPLPKKPTKVSIRPLRRDEVLAGDKSSCRSKVRPLSPPVLDEPVQGTSTSATPVETTLPEPSIEDSALIDSMMENPSTCMGPDGRVGYDAVTALADALLALRERHVALSNEEALVLFGLWTAMEKFDKQKSQYTARFSPRKFDTGFFRRTKSVVPGVESMNRCLLANKVPATSPTCNRYVEALFISLAQLHRSPTKSKTRFQLVASDYKRIQTLVNGNPLLVKSFDLPDVNDQLLRRWHHDREASSQTEVLSHGIATMDKLFTSTSPLPEAVNRPTTMAGGSVAAPFVFQAPSNLEGLAKVKKRKSCSDGASVSGPTRIAPRPVPLTALLSPRFLLPQQTAQPVRTDLPSVSGLTRIAPRPVPLTALLPPQFGLPVITAQPVRTLPAPKNLRRCKFCGDNWSTAGHNNYMFRLYCPKRETMSVQEWKAKLKSEGVGKRKK